MPRGALHVRWAWFFFCELSVLALKIALLRAAFFLALGVFRVCLREFMLAPRATAAAAAALLILLLLLLISLAWWLVFACSGWRMCPCRWMFWR